MPSPVSDIEPHEGDRAPSPHPAPQPTSAAPRWRVHVALFVLTLATMFAAGIYMADSDPLSPEPWGDPRILGLAGAYAAAMMAILFVHEMGHYLLARRHRIEVTPPYFLPGIGPLPDLGIIPLFGTFGAFIRMQMGPIRARPLLEIAAWGPLAGFILTVPVLFVGMSLSEVRPVPDAPFMMLGDSLLLMLAEHLFHPDIPDGHDVFLHPLAMAGWVGCLLTALNLLPIGQLDGGHIAYSVFGERYRPVALGLFATLVVLGVFVFPGWLFFAILILVMGPTHPPIMVGAPARGRPLWLAGACAAIFALTFTPAPIVVESLPRMLGLW